MTDIEKLKYEPGTASNLTVRRRDWLASSKDGASPSAKQEARAKSGAGHEKGLAKKGGESDAWRRRMWIGSPCRRQRNLKIGGCERLQQGACTDVLDFTR